jgi:hypothetical protein
MCQLYLHKTAWGIPKGDIMLYNLIIKGNKFKVAKQKINENLFSPSLLSLSA